MIDVPITSVRRSSPSPSKGSGGTPIGPRRLCYGPYHIRPLGSVAPGTTEQPSDVADHDPRISQRGPYRHDVNRGPRSHRSAPRTRLESSIQPTIALEGEQSGNRLSFLVRIICRRDLLSIRSNTQVTKRLMHLRVGLTGSAGFASCD